MGRRKTKDINFLVKRMTTLDINSKPTSSSAAEYAGPAEPAQPFRFFDLPGELRLRVYELLLVFPKTIDLDPANTRNIAPHLRLFTVSQRMHDEASRVFYSRNTFRVFPIHSRYINKKHPLLAWIPRKYREHITRLELRVGPGFTSPPKHWVVDSRLGLAATTRVYKLRIFVEIDPSSHPSFGEWIQGREYYTEYCVGLVRALLARVCPVSVRSSLMRNPGVSKTSELLVGLMDEAKLNQKRITWGDERGWDVIVDGDLAGILRSLGIDGI